MIYGFVVFAAFTVVCFGKAFTHSIMRCLWYLAAIVLGFMAGVGISLTNPTVSGLWWAAWVLTCAVWLGWFFWDSVTRRAAGQ